MYYRRRINVSLDCLITATLLTSISTTSISVAQSNGGYAESHSTTPQVEDSMESIPELRLRIKELVQKLQDKKRIKKEQEQNPSPPSLNNTSEESDTPQASQIFRAPKTNQPTDAPQSTEIPQAPTAPKTPEQSQTPVSQQSPIAPKTSGNIQDPASLRAPEETQPPMPSPPSSSDTSENASTKLAAPGEFKVDEESAQRALERTLVQSGALLLQKGQIDLETSLSFARNQQSVPAFVNTDTELLAASEEVRDSTLGAALHLRIGLPFESQLELGVPYRYIDSSSVTRIGFAVASERSTYDNGIGDVTVGLAKTLLKEKGRRPDLIARLSWDADNGDKNEQQDSPKGRSSHNEYGGSLTVTKRQDPLIFTGNLSYEYAETRDNFQPGESISLSMGTVLAASPETSLRFALNQTLLSEFEINNQKISGSDRLIGSLSLGASSVLDRRNFLNVSVDMGLTDDATDYSLNIAYIRRFTGLFSSQ